MSHISIHFMHARLGMEPGLVSLIPRLRGGAKLEVRNTIAFFNFGTKMVYGVEAIGFNYTHIHVHVPVFSLYYENREDLTTVTGSL